MSLMVRLGIRYRGEIEGPKYVESFRGVALERIRVEPGVVRAWDFTE